jgi:hypothetical protein
MLWVRVVYLLHVQYNMGLSWHKQMSVGCKHWIEIHNGTNKYGDCHRINTILMVKTSDLLSPAVSSKCVLEPQLNVDSMGSLCCLLSSHKSPVVALVFVLATSQPPQKLSAPSKSLPPFIVKMAYSIARHCCDCEGFASRSTKTFCWPLFPSSFLTGRKKY